VWVSDIEGSTVIVHLPHQKPAGRPALVVPGFVGSVTLRCTDTAVAHRLNALLRLAQYTGIGAHPSHSLGTLHLAQARPSSRHPR
jgi:CRISPR/Cas system endoribonuclease Cas6 (RAMP superfamily)